MFVGHFAVAFAGKRMRAAQARVFCLACLSSALLAGARASAVDRPKVPPAAQDTIRTRLSDPKLFENLRSSQQVLAAWLDSVEVVGCDGGNFKPSHLGCHRFEVEPVSVAPVFVQRLLRLLPRCTWTRPATKAELDCGVQFRGPAAWVDIGINVDSMSLTLFAEGDSPVRGYPPPKLASELAWVAANIPAHSKRSRSKVDIMLLRWSDAMTASLGACDQSDQAGDGGKSDQAEEGEFVYYEEPPVAIRQEAPVAPGGPAIQGSHRVILHVLVRKDGRVCSAKVIRGNPLLAAAAIDAVREWEWKPAQSNNKPVAVWVELPIDVP